MSGGDGELAPGVVTGGESEGGFVEAGFVEGAMDIVDDPEVDGGICGDTDVITDGAVASRVEAEGAVLDCSDSSICPR